LSVIPMRLFSSKVGYPGVIAGHMQA
jgi:hypothetical protein